MIVSVCLPMIGALDAPAELDRAADRSETHGGSTDPCLGHDACHGTDAGSAGNEINLTDDFSWTGEETVTWYGSEANATGYSATAEENIDSYLIDMPAGYGLTVDILWNYTGVSMDQYAFMVAMGPGDGCMTNYYVCDWGYDYYSTTGHVAISSDGEDMGGNYGAGIGSSSYSGGAIDIAGDPVTVLVWCYYCHYSGVSNEYTMNITVWPGDGGVRGDETTPQYSQLGSVNMYGDYTTYYDFEFELDGSVPADVMIECDYWCPYENYIDITLPNGTVWTEGYWASYWAGTIATFSDAGTYHVEIFDSYGDAGVAMNVGALLGNFSGLLTATDYVFEDSASGHVDSTDTSDIYAIYLPENYKANVTLKWENSADLDLEIYSDWDATTETLSGMLAYSWFDQPEFVDLGQLGAAQTVYAEVIHYSGPSSGYFLELETEPGAPPPCFFQDDGSAEGEGVYTAAGGDAPGGDYSPDDDPIDVSGHAVDNGDGTWSGEFTGMACDGYDEQDWFSVSVPAGHGAHVMLEWPEGVDTNFNDTTEVEGLLSLQLYTSTGSAVTYVPYGLETNPTAAATNESYTWASTLSVDSDLYIKVSLLEMTEDYENNYTVTFSIYNATEHPWQMACQNDAGLAPIGGCADAGATHTDSLNLTTVNQTFTGYGHDEFDEYDYYRIYLPTNYAAEICVDFPVHNDIDVALYYVNPTYGWLSFIASSYYDNPECVWAQYDDAGQDIFLRVWTDIGSGNYEVSMSFLTPGLAPGDNQDDCGMAGSVPGGDAADLVYPGTWSGHTFTNESTQADLNPYDANGSVRESWDGGVCTGWVSYVWDSYDMYSIAVPEGTYVNIDYDFDLEGEGDPNTYHAVYMLMCQMQHMPCQYPANGAYYVMTNSGYGLDTLSQNSGLWPVGTFHNSSGCDTPFPNPECATNGWDASNSEANTPGWLYVYVWTCCASAPDHEYEMNITFHPLSDLEGGVQNDANSGTDAGPGPSTAIHANDFLNQSQSDTLANDGVLTFDGWNMAGLDSTDRFTFDVPANHGVEIELTPGDDRPDVWMLLDVFDNSWNQIGGMYYSNPQVYNTSTIASPFDSWMGIGVRNWGNYDTEDGTNYTVNVTFYTLDADGDGWLDQLEIDCNTDPYDANSTPTDTDGDGECDFLDEDIDGDGVGNDLDEMPMDENGTADLDGDGIPDDTDPDVDGDGWDNIEELVCLGAGSMADVDNTTVPTDYDGDGLCDTVAASDIDHALASTYLDPDGDNDGTDDETDAFDFDPCADTDTDHDQMPDDILGGLNDSSDMGNPDWTTMLNGVDYDGPAGVPDGEFDNLLDANGDGDYGDLADDYDGDGVSNEDEMAAYGGYTWSIQDYCHPATPTGLVEDTDDDGDGYNDTYEAACGSDPLLPMSFPTDNDGDDECDTLDDDDDNDGVADADDLWPLDHTEWSDNDGDGQGDNRDMDDDNDGWWDSCDQSDWLAAQNSSLSGEAVEGINYFPGQTGGIASTCPDNVDAFPEDADEWIDTDGDGVGDNTDLDDDDDGWLDADEITCGSDPLSDAAYDPAITGIQGQPLDADGDDLCDVAMDEDDDGDGIEDEFDAFPTDASENADSDGDGIGDDTDDDNDNDGWTDDQEKACFALQEDQWLDTMQVPTDNDRDGECDLVDGDDDNDGVIDLDDAFPNNPLEREDSDGDGIGDNSDNDDDGDGWLDATEVSCANAGGTGDKDEASETPSDFDGDGICDATDVDDDNDGHPDPKCVGSASKVEYVDCAVGDEDRFPRDATEWYDANEDGLGDEANPVTLIDKMTFDPLPYLGIVAVIGALGYGLLQMNQGASRSDEDEAEDYTEEFEDFDFEDDDEPVDDDEDNEED